NPAAVQAQMLQQVQARQMALEVARGGGFPSTALTILLAPVSAPRSAASTATAVKVEALPAVADYRGTHPDDTLLVLLQATAEPKLGLEHVTDVRVTRAVADTGRELVAKKVSDPPAG